MGERGRYAAEVAGSSPAPPTIVFLGLLREPEIRSISAVTLATRDMARAVRFDEALGFPMAYDARDIDDMLVLSGLVTRPAAGP